MISKINQLPRYVYFLAAYCLAFALYWPSLHGTPIWDDYNFWFSDHNMTIPYNFYWRNFTWPLSVSVQKFMLTTLKKDYFGYHLFNLFLHSVNSYLVYRLARLLRFRYAFIFFLLFLLHPVAVISTAWMIQMKTLLSFTFAILAVIAFLKGNKNINWMYASWFFFLLSMLSKSSSIAIPAIFLFISFRFYRFSKLHLLIPFFLISGWGAYKVLRSSITIEGTQKAAAVTKVKQGESEIPEIEPIAAKDQEARANYAPPEQAGPKPLPGQREAFPLSLERYPDKEPMTKLPDITSYLNEAIEEADIVKKHEENFKKGITEPPPEYKKKIEEKKKKHIQREEYRPRPKNKEGVPVRPLNPITVPLPMGDSENVKSEVKPPVVKPPLTFMGLDFNNISQTLHYYFWQSLVPENNIPVKGLNYKKAGVMEIIHVFFIIIMIALFWKDAAIFYLAAGHFLLLPFIGIIPAPFMNVTWVSDQHLYLVLVPMLAFWMRLFEKVKWKYALVFPSVLVLFYSFKTYQATSYYKDQFTFYEKCIEYNPLNVPMSYNLAFARILHGDLNLAYNALAESYYMAQQEPLMKKNFFYPFMAQLYIQVKQTLEKSENEKN